MTVPDMTAPDWTAHLQPGERLLWQGAPVKARYLTAWQCITIVLGALMVLLGAAMFFIGAIAVFLADTLIGAMGVLFLTAIGLLVGVTGGAVVVEPFRQPKALARHDRYALSDKAAYVMRRKPVFSLTVHPITPETVITLEKLRHADNIQLHNIFPAGADDPYDHVNTEFASIADGAAVFQMIRSLQTGART